MNPLVILFALVLTFCGSSLCWPAEERGFLESLPAQVRRSARSSDLREWVVPPVRLVWQSEQGVANAAGLMQPKPGQAVLSEPSPPCQMVSSPTGSASLVLDFGVELQGYVELFTPMTGNHAPAPVRVRFGESVSEAMSEPGTKNSQNDHAVRDQTVVLPWLGKKRVGPSGFRFVRLDAADPRLPVSGTVSKGTASFGSGICIRRLAVLTPCLAA